MAYRLKEKVALVTGAATGIGRATIVFVTANLLGLSTRLCRQKFSSRYLILLPEAKQSVTPSNSILRLL